MTSFKEGKGDFIPESSSRTGFKSALLTWQPRKVKAQARIIAPKTRRLKYIGRKGFVILSFFFRILRKSGETVYGTKVFAMRGDTVINVNVK